MFAVKELQRLKIVSPNLSANSNSGSTMEAELVQRADEIRQRLKQLGDSL